MANRMSMLNNVGGLAPYFGMNLFIDWWRISSTITVGRSVGGSISGKAAWDAGVYLDPSTGDLISPAPSDVTSIAKTFFDPPEARTWVSGLNFGGETWFAEWDGTGTCTISGAGTGASQATVNSNKISFTFGTSPSSVTATFNVSNRNDPPRNIRIYQARHATNMANGERFNPDWIAEIKNFGVLRLMDVMATNNSCITSLSQMAGFAYHGWSQGYYDTTTNPIQNGNRSPSGGGPKGSTHPEVICELVRVTGVPEIHVCIPPYAPDQFVSDFSTYMRDHCSAKVTYERGNEPWNFGFNHFAYYSKQGCRIWGKIASAVTKGTTTRLNIPNHGLTHGGKTDTYCAASGWSSLDLKAKWVSVVDANNVDLYNDAGLTTPFDSSGLPAWDGSETMLSQDLNRSYKWYGLRAANDMKIVRDVYDDRSRWKGALGVFTAVASITSQMYVGIDYYLANVLSPADSLTTNDLFDAAYVTNYFGGQMSLSKVITNITQAANGQVTCPSHGLSSGATLKLFIATGMTQLNNQRVTISVVDVDNFTIGVNTSAYSAWASNSQNFCAPSKYWDLMDQSNANFVADPVTYPTKYTYFNQQIAQGLLTGSNSYGMSGSDFINPVSTLISSVWPSNYTVIKSRNLEMRAYEGGCHFLGDGTIQASGISAQFNEYLVAFGHSAECAAVYAACYKGFVQCGGKLPSKFVDAGQTGRYGTWGGVRYWPLNANGGVGDAGNPVWQATREWNDNLQPETWAARYGA